MSSFKRLKEKVLERARQPRRVLQVRVGSREHYAATELVEDGLLAEVKRVSTRMTKAYIAVDATSTPEEGSCDVL
jgi:hypothetical protein